MEPGQRRNAVAVEMGSFTGRGEKSAAWPAPERVKVGHPGREELVSGVRARRETTVSTPTDDEQAISLDEASRQLELAVHDAQVAYDCIALGNLNRAHTNAITARTAAGAAETLLRSVLGEAGSISDPD